MKKGAFFLGFLLIFGCNGEKGPTQTLSRSPVSVRGWIADVEQPGEPGKFRTVETEAARRIELFQQTSVWIEGKPFVSGGVAETGAFLLLDVPPGDVEITFNAPGAEHVKLVLKNIPGSADVFIPALLLTPTGSKALEPNLLKVRMAAKIDKERPTGKTVEVAGVQVPIVETPYNDMQDRRDYPDIVNAPGQRTPVATVK